MKLTQQVLDDLEKKEYEIEIKELNEENGTFKGLLSPYGNVDGGNDRAMPTAGKRNNGKVIPFLLQHVVGTEQGELKLINTKEGIAVDGKLYLDKLENGNPIFPEAFRTYVLAKKGKLKLSMGYKTIKYEFVQEGGKTIRNLIDFEIMEGSRVTFPMNEMAIVPANEVKSEGGNNLEVEEKAMGFADLLKVQQANDMRWKLQDALNCAFRLLMDDETMDINAKLAQLDVNVNEFATAYKENMTLILQSSAKNKTAKKQVDEILETKSAETLETKAGAKISKANKAKLTQCKDGMSNLMALIDELCGGMQEDDGEGEEGKTSKTPAKKEENTPTQQKTQDDDKLELKSDELEAIKKFYNLTKGVSK